MVTLPFMRELSVSEQRYRAVLAVISDGETVTQVAARFGVARKTVYVWLARYEAGGIDNLVDRSHRPGRVRIRSAPMSSCDRGAAAGASVLGAAAAGVRAGQAAAPAGSAAGSR